MQGLPLPGESRAVEDRMISCRGVTKTYVVRERAGLFRRGVRGEIEALRGLDLEIARGAFVELLGHTADESLRPLG